jgi:calcium/calmodulin-dependent protein kinase I
MKKKAPDQPRKRTASGSHLRDRISTFFGSGNKSQPKAAPEKKSNDLVEHVAAEDPNWLEVHVGWYRVEVADLAGETTRLLVRPHATMKDIKEMVAQVLGVPAWRQNFNVEWDEHILSDKSTAEQCKMTDGCSIYLIKSIAFADTYTSVGTDNLVGIGAESMNKNAYSCRAATHNSTGQQVLVRTWPVNCKEDVYAPANTEAKMHTVVKHRHILPFIAVYRDEEDAKLRIVTEMPAGGELFDRIVAKEFYPEQDAKQLMRVLLSATGCMHEHGYVNRNLKPESIVLRSPTDDTDVWIAGFDFLHRIDSAGPKEESLMNTACGTPGYVAPEVLSAEGYGDEVDVWALGVICFVVLCGYPPFYHETTSKLYKQIKEADYSFASPYWDNISAEGKDLIAKMLVVDPKERWSCAQLLEHGWLSEANGECCGRARRD